MNNKKNENELVTTLILLVVAIALYLGVRTYNVVQGNYTVTSYGTCVRAEQGKICEPWFGRGSVYIPDNADNSNAQK